MTPARRDLILAALGLRPRNGRMPRWSHRNRYFVPDAAPSEWPLMVGCGWAERANYVKTDSEMRQYHVTRAGADAAGVLGRVRKEDMP